MQVCVCGSCSETVSTALCCPEQAGLPRRCQGQNKVNALPGRRAVRTGIAAAARGVQFYIYHHSKNGTSTGCAWKGQVFHSMKDTGPERFAHLSIMLTRMTRLM